MIAVSQSVAEGTPLPHYPMTTLPHSPITFAPMIPAYLDRLFEGQQYDPKSFFLIAGPCVVESEENVFEIGAHLAAVCKRLAIPLVLKASYRKANRTSATSFTGHGDQFGLGTLQKAGKHFGL